MTAATDSARRFGGISRLYGNVGLAKLQAAHITVVGVGGVGSWAVEALARSAVGQLTLIDLDHIAPSNFNRQLHAVIGNEGKAKVDAMKERVLSINPNCLLTLVDEFVTPENVETIIPTETQVVIDCTDDVKAKTALAVYCKQANLPLLMSGSAGGRLDSTRMQVSDLAHVIGDKLLFKVRKQLRREHNFPQATGTKKKAKKFNVQCVYSDELVRTPDMACDVGDDQESTSITGLNCAGFGSSVSVTAPFGFALAQLAINQVV